MKQLTCAWPVLLTGLLCAPTVARAQQDETNRLYLAARLGFKISARFAAPSSLALPSSTRKTPNGDLYNYDDGYVFTDIRGPGQNTWYWGYDNNVSQVSGNNILLSRSTLANGSPSVTLGDDVSPGAELVYRRLLSPSAHMNLGFEFAANYQNVSMSDSSTLSANLTRTTYPFPFTPGTTPPLATPAAPFTGSFEGPNFVIGSTHGTPTVTEVVGGASVMGHRQFDADLFGFRVGPYLEAPLGNGFKASFSGGVASAWVNGTASWNETASMGGMNGDTVSGSGHAGEMRFGGYVAGDIAWQFAQRWSVVAGAQYQTLGNLTHSYGGRDVTLNLSHSVFATFGVSFNF